MTTSYFAGFEHPAATDALAERRTMKSRRFTLCTGPPPGVYTWRTLALEESVMVRNRLPRPVGPLSVVAAAFAIMSAGTLAQSPAAPEVTFSKDTSRILQRSCQECHH